MSPIHDEPQQPEWFEVFFDLMFAVAVSFWAERVASEPTIGGYARGAGYLVLTRNSGAAFSLGTGYTFVFPVVSLLVIGWIGWMAARLRSVPWAVSLGLVLGGALGNLGDRIFRAPGFMVGHVVDFISVFSNDGHVFPIFNAADSALCCGVVLAILLELTGRRRDGTRVRQTGTRDHD